MPSRVASTLVFGPWPAAGAASCRAPSCLRWRAPLRGRDSGSHRARPPPTGAKDGSPPRPPPGWASTWPAGWRYRLRYGTAGPGPARCNGSRAGRLAAALGRWRLAAAQANRIERQPLSAGATHKKKELRAAKRTFRSPPGQLGPKPRGPNSSCTAPNPKPPAKAAGPLLCKCSQLLPAGGCGYRPSLHARGPPGRRCALVRLQPRNYSFWLTCAIRAGTGQSAQRPALRAGLSIYTVHQAATLAGQLISWRRPTRRPLAKLPRYGTGTWRPGGSLRSSPKRLARRQTACCGCCPVVPRSHPSNSGPRSPRLRPPDRGATRLNSSKSFANAICIISCSGYGDKMVNCSIFAQYQCLLIKVINHK